MSTKTIVSCDLCGDEINHEGVLTNEFYVKVDGFDFVIEATAAKWKWTPNGPGRIKTDLCRDCLTRLVLSIRKPGETA